MDASPPFSPPRTVALVGLMGAGKSAIGKRLALRLGLPFVDADEEIERAAGMPIAEIFAKFGEDYFRDGVGYCMATEADMKAPTLFDMEKIS